ncbi:lysM domain-containing GPI-anchored protein 1 isoform X2 [Ricinus communis]|uniref:lysM domain-containing GPI-anchored protein 1 isoform X2 n=1 Tax=Ricinus communis TaxID=3988 RepID=UPI00201A3E1A|nr:lysM domain-containing GPI-anchored protein 1 isoform X2 [Ricinus communis]
MNCPILHSLLLISVLVPIFPCTIHAKSIIEPCISSDSCPSLLSYLLPFDSQLPAIAYRFGVNISDILATNSIDPEALPSINNQILHANSLVKIPISCPCVEGIRRLMSTSYTVKPADTVDSISLGFGGLVSGEQITSTNGINANNPLMIGQKLVIPLPCSCFDNNDNGVAAVYMSYVVQNGESLEKIAMEFDTTVMDLENVNGFGQPQVDPGDILAVPISACSSTNLNWYNQSLLVPNGSYALTANNCIKCLCLPRNLSLQCLPSGIGDSCSHLQCKDSNLFIGDQYVQHTATACNITACVYRGYSGRKILRKLLKSSNVQCPGNHSYNAISPLASPSFNPIEPSIALPPLLSPSSAPHPSMGIDGSNPRNNQNFNASSNGEFLGHISFSLYTLFLLEIFFCFFF